MKGCKVNSGKHIIGLLRVGTHDWSRRIILLICRHPKSNLVFFFKILNPGNFQTNNFNEIFQFFILPCYALVQCLFFYIFYSLLVDSLSPALEKLGEVVRF